MTSSAELSWEQLVPGDPMRELVKVPTPMQLFMFSAVTWNRHLIHYNTEFARADGLKHVAVHRALIGGMLAQMISEWIGDDGAIQSLEWSVRGSAEVNRPLKLVGHVTGKRQVDDDLLVDCDVRAEDEQGNVIAPGTLRG